MPRVPAAVPAVPAVIPAIIVAILVACSGASAQTAFCSTFAFCDASVNDGFCCPVYASASSPQLTGEQAGGYSTPAFAGAPTLCGCQSDDATDSADLTTATTAPAWTVAASAQAGSTTQVALYALSNSGLLMGFTGYFVRFSMFVQGSAVPSTLDTAVTNTGVWNTGGVWPASTWTHFTVQVFGVIGSDTANATALSDLMAYRVSAAAAVATGQTTFPSTFVSFTAPTRVVDCSVGGGGNATFAAIVAPSDCAFAGVVDAPSCDRYCSFMNGGNTPTTANVYTVGSGCQCGTGVANTVFPGSPATVYACSSVATTSSSTTTTTASTGGGGSGSGSGSTSGGSGSGGSSSNAATIAGATVGVIAGVSIIVGILYVVVKHKYRNMASSSSSTVFPLASRGDGSHA